MLPIACSLDAAELAERRQTWERLSAEHLRDRAEIPGGLALTYAAAAEPAVRELARLETACCAWAAWKVSRVGGEVRLDVTAPGDGASAVRAMFAA